MILSILKHLKLPYLLILYRNVIHTRLKFPLNLGVKFRDFQLINTSTFSDSLQSQFRIQTITSLFLSYHHCNSLCSSELLSNIICFLIGAHLDVRLDTLSFFLPVKSLLLSFSLAHYFPLNLLSPNIFKSFYDIYIHSNILYRIDAYRPLTLVIKLYF